MSVFLPGDDAVITQSMFGNEGRRVLITGYSSHQPEGERWYQVVGIGEPLNASAGQPVNIEESHLAQEQEQ